jgi:hypothetical protein
MYRRHLCAAALVTALVGCSQAPPQDVAVTPNADTSAAAPETPTVDKTVPAIKQVAFKIEGMA